MNNILKYFNKRSVVLWSVLVLSLIGILTLSFYAENKLKQPARDKGQAQTIAPSLAASPTPTPAPEKAAEFKLQLGLQSAGRVINTDYLSATDSGWLVLYDDKEGVPGNLIEAAIPPFDPGVQRQAVFILSQPLEAGKSYWAVLSKEKTQGEFVRQKFSIR